MGVGLSLRPAMQLLHQACDVGGKVTGRIQTFFIISDLDRLSAESDIRVD